MPSADQVKVYKPPESYYAFAVIGMFLIGGMGIAYTAAYKTTGWFGVMTGLLFILMTVLIGVAIARTGVTVHEQGIVIRQRLTRKFIPWEAVEFINTGEPTGDISVLPRDYRERQRPAVWVYVSTGVKYVEKWERLDATSGDRARVRKIAAEMEEFRRRERDARLAASGDSGPSRLPPPVTPDPPRIDYNPPPLGKALW